MPTQFDDWLKDYKQTPNVLGEQPTAVLEPLAQAEPASFDEWLKQKPEKLGWVEQFAVAPKEAAKALFGRMPAYVAANMGDVIFWLAEQDRAKIPAVIPAVLAALIPQEQWGRGQAKMIQYAKGISDHWRKEAATGWKKRDPRIDAMSWSEAPVLKGLVSGIESSGTFLAAVASGIITKNPTVGLVLLGAASGGGAYRELREEGVEQELANATALLVGTFEAVTEKLPFNAIFGKGSKRLLTKFLKSASLESLQEFFQNMGENYFTHFAKEYQETGEVGESLKIEWAQLMENWQDAIAGGIVMGGAGAVMTGRAGLEPREPGLAEAAPMPEMAPEEKQQRLEHSLLARAGGLEKDMRIMAEKVKLAEPETEEEHAATEIAARFGKQAVWFTDPTGITGVAGSIMPDTPDTVYMKVGAKRPAVLVMTHELVHHLERDAPEVYTALRESIEKYTMNKAAYFKGYPAMRMLSKEQADAEFVADMVGQVGLQPDFWNNIAREEPGVLERIITAIRRIIDVALGKDTDLTRFKAEPWAFPHLQDFVQIQKAAEQAFRAWAPAARKGAQLRKLRQAARKKAETGIEITPEEIKLLQMKPRHIREMVAGEIQAAERIPPRAYRVKEYIQTKEGRIMRAPTVKRKIKRAVGMEVPAKPVVTTEREALRVRLKAQETGAAMGLKAGLAMGREKALELKARYKTLGEWRKAFRKYVKQSLPRDVQGTMLTAMEGIKGEKSYEKALKNLVAKIEQVQTRQALTRLQTQVKKITKKWGRKGTFGGYKLLPEYEKILDDLMGWFTTKREMAEEKRADLNELLQWAIDEQEALEAKGQTDTPYQQFDVVPTIRRLQKELGDVSVARWPAEKIDTITDALLTIVYQHLYEREAFNRAMKQRLDADIAQGIKDISEAAGRPQEPPAEVGPDIPKGIVARTGAEAKALVGRHNYNLSTMAKIISGMKEKGPVWRRLAGALEVGVGRAIEQRFTAEDMLRSMMIEKGITAREVMSWSRLLRRAAWQGPKWLKKLADLDISVEDKTAEFVRTKFITVPLESGQELKLTVAEALDIYMHTRNPDNYKVLTGKNGVSFYGKPVKEGQRFTAHDISNITEALFAQAPKARDMVEIIETVLALQQNAINETSRKLLGYDLATLPGYWHIRRLLPKVARGKKAAFTYETVEGRSHWRERVGGPHPLVLGDVFNNLIETVEVGAEYVGIAEPLRNAKTMLSDKNFRDSAEKQGFGKYLTDISWQIGQLEKSGSEKEWAERWLGGWQRNVTRAIFGFSLRLAAQQEISVFLAFAKIPFKYATALRPGITKDVVDRIEAWSPYLRHRFQGHVSREVGDVARTGGVLRFFTGKDQFSNWGTWIVKHFDKRAIVNVWRMVEAELADRGEFSHLNRAQLYKNGAYQAQVVARAEQVMRDTQPTWHKVDRSLIGSSPNMAVRIMTMFHSQREKMVQMVGQANATYRNSDKAQKDKVKLSRTYGMIALNLALINAWKVAFGVLIMRRKDEPEEWATNVLADIPGMFYIVGPPIRESVKAASRAFRRKPVYQLGVVSLPPFKILETGSASLFAWEKVALEALGGNNVEKELLAALDKTWEFSQYALGLPFHSTTRIAKKWSE